MRLPSIPEPVTDWLKSVIAWNPNPRSMRFWTQVAVIMTYFLFDIWAGLWGYGGSHSHILDVVTTDLVFATVILVLVHRHRNRQSFLTLLPLSTWVILMGFAAGMTYVGFLQPPGNGHIVFFGLLGILAPLVGQALDARSAANKTE